MGSRAAKEALFEAQAGAAKALASGRRAEIVDLLAQGERTVEEVATELDQSVANTSHHLRTLARAGLVKTRRDGTRIWYRLASDRVAELWGAVRDVAADHVVGVHDLAHAYLGRGDDLEPVTRSELARRLEAGDVVVIDARPPREFQAGHVDGARSVPIDELEAYLESIPVKGEIVAYCRGPYCAYADDAVRLLRNRGLDARRLEDGFPEWRRAGLPISVGEDTGS